MLYILLYDLQAGVDYPFHLLRFSFLFLIVVSALLSTLVLGLLGVLGITVISTIICQVVAIGIVIGIRAKVFF